MEEERMNKLFNLVFKNIVLFKLIFNHVKIFKKNEFVSFKTRKELIEYSERDYIQKLEYHCDEPLEINDLLNNSLEVITFKSKYPYDIETTHLWKLPKTVYKVKNVVMIPSSSSSSSFGIQSSYNIPSNIKSISFNKCPNISSLSIKSEINNNNNNNNNDNRMIIPNSIKKLELTNYDFEIPLCKGDIPESVEVFSAFSLDVNILKGALPNSIKELKLSYLQECELDLVIPNSVEKLFISHFSKTIKPNSNLCKCNSIKKLEICSNGWSVFKPYSLPSSITDISITNTTGVFDIGSIPNGVINLEIHFMITHRDNEIKDGSIPNTVKSLSLENAIFTQLPSSLTNLILVNYNDRDGDGGDGDINQLISILPSSLISITLPSYYESNNLKLPLSIIDINYN
ncbi:hypothetical protein ACTFIY_008196 [Dictyostelium cf. discoideum]